MYFISENNFEKNDGWLIFLRPKKESLADKPPSTRLKNQRKYFHPFFRHKNLVCGTSQENCQIFKRGEVQQITKDVFYRGFSGYRKRKKRVKKSVKICIPGKISIIFPSVSKYACTENDTMECGRVKYRYFLLVKWESMY